MSFDLPYELAQYLTHSDGQYTHVVKWKSRLYRFDVPLDKQRSFYRFVKDAAHFTPDAVMHQVTNLAREVEKWASLKTTRTEDRKKDRLSAQEVFGAFCFDTGLNISARALGDVLMRVLDWQRVKSNGKMVYVAVKMG